MGYVEARINSKGETTFRAQVRLKGHAPVTRTFVKKSDAKQWISQTETAMHEGEFLSTNEAKKHTVSETIDRYIEDTITDPTREAQRIAKLQWFKDHIGFKRLSDVTPPVIAECRRKLKSELVRGKPRIGATTNRYCSALSAVFEYAKDSLCWCKKNPVHDVRWERESEGVIRFLSEEERQRLLLACEQDEEPLILAIVVLALSTGMRKEEIRTLRWDEVDLEQGAIRLSSARTKNRTPRRVPLRGRALQLIKNLRDTQHASRLVRLHSTYVFPNSTGTAPIYLRPIWERVRDNAQLENFRFHDLRHSCASYLAMNGASLLEIAEVLGHKTLAMVKRYSHLAESHVSGVVERMNNKVFGA